jgi:hypothetical protein
MLTKNSARAECGEQQRDVGCGIGYVFEISENDSTRTTSMTTLLSESTGNSFDARQLLGDVCV